MKTFFATQGKTFWKSLRIFSTLKITTKSVYRERYSDFENKDISSTRLFMDRLLTLLRVELSFFLAIINRVRRLSISWTLHYSWAREEGRPTGHYPAGTDSKQHRNKCSGNNKKIRIKSDLKKDCILHLQFLIWLQEKEKK